jgi:hypothetical protein
MPWSASFAEFYPAYLADHRHPVNRALHLAAKLAMVAALATAVLERSLLAALTAPMLAVLPCWLGHWVFEGNRPTAWTRPSASALGSLALAITGAPGATASRGGRPYYSFLADLKMCLSMVRGSDPGQGARRE